MFKIIGGLCIAFGIADLASFYIWKYDITGFQYSPYIAFIAGYFIMKIGDGGDDE